MYLPTRTLTLIPSRYGGTFEAGSWAHIVPDRPVLYLGDQLQSVTLLDLSVLASAQLLPTALADGEAQFKYHVRIRQTTVSDFFITMPDADAALYDLVAIDQDLNTLIPSELANNYREAP